MKNTLLILALIAPLAHATTFPAATCNQPDVLSAINAAVAAGSGNTVTVPAGTCTWTTALNKTLTVSLSVVGAGTSAVGGGDLTNIIDNVNHGSTDYTINIVTGAPATSFRWSGITILANGGSSTSNNGVFNIGGASQNVRIDHNHFNKNNQLELNMTSQIAGVVDHNIFDLADLGARSTAGGWANTGTPGTGDGNGDGSWADTANPGASNIMYLENNVFTNYAVGSPTPANDCISGGRFVMRFNTFNFGAALQTHPTGHDGSTGNDRGCRYWEIYKNNFVDGQTGLTNPEYNMMFMSSGTGIMWGNSINKYRYGLTLHNMRHDNNTYPQTTCSGTNCSAGWGYCGTSFNGTGSTWDQAAGTTNGYACLDQVGTGKSDLLSGTFPNKCDATTGCGTVQGTWPNQAKQPLYEWSDTWVGTAGYPGTFSLIQEPQITQNTDFYLWCDPSAPSGACTFNGTVGVGSGTLASRPATCTTGVAYWATDQGNWNSSGSGGQGVLYKCTSTNAWSVYYTPYAYPHPLTGTTPPAATPTFSIAAGSYSTPQWTTISCSTPSSSIFYTVDGTTPTISSPKYTHRLLIAETQTLQAVCTASGFTTSAVGSAAYTIAVQPTSFSMSTTVSSINPSPTPAVVRSCCNNSWSNIEGTRGTYSFTAQEAWTTQASNLGAKFMYTFAHVPGWANGNAGITVLPTDLHTVSTCQAPLAGVVTTNCTTKEAVTKAMQHACGVTSQPGTPLIGTCNINQWEIWNEFNTNGYLSNSYSDMATMANDESAIVHAYSGDTEVVLGSVSAGGDGSNPAGGSGVWYTALEAVAAAWYAIPNASLWDAVSYHDYAARTPISPAPMPETLASNSDATCTLANTPNPSCRTAIMNQTGIVQSSVVNLNPAIKQASAHSPVYVTEGGWGKTLQLCDGADCDPTHANVQTLRNAAVSRKMLVQAAAHTPMVLLYQYAQDCNWSPMINRGGTSTVCTGPPPALGTGYSYLQAYAQTQTWLTGATIGTLSFTTVSGGKMWTLLLDSGASQIVWYDGWLGSHTQATTFATQQNLQGATSATGGNVTATNEPKKLTSGTLPTAATPTFSPVAGTYSSTQSVTISSTTPSNTIYYTTDGSTPTTGSTIYTVPVVVSVSSTVKAIATASGFLTSAVGSATYTITIPQAATPTFAPIAGTYTSVQSVTISDSTPASTIYYTTDGSIPTTGSTVYSTPISVGVNTTIKAIATASGFTQSAVGTAAYVINFPAAATPTFSPLAGTYSSVQTVTISTTTPSSTLYYTLDGSTPTHASSVYSTPLTVASTTTVKAIAAATGFSDSSVGSATYVINFPTVATPTFSPVAGSYGVAQTVTISTVTSGATLCFTIDGSTPTADGAGTCTHGTTYSTTITVSTSQTVKAVGSKSANLDSAVASAAYVINGTAVQPTPAPPQGNYTAPQTVSLTTTTPGGVIHYTTDGSTPDGSSATYTTPLSITVTTTLKSITIATGYANSPVTTSIFTITALSPPTITGSITMTGAGTIR